MTSDSGARLRAMYENEGGVGNVFTRKVADYVASRPDYPEAFFAMLDMKCGLEPGCRVADIGAGTGLLTRGLLLRGCSVVAVEPNPAMRQAADHLLGTHPGFRSADGSAERIPLEPGSVDLITAAHAFHWFDVQAARRECLRVLRPGGQVALVWNDRLLTHPLHVSLDAVLDDYGGAKRDALVAHEERGDIGAFFGETVPGQYAWPHQHTVSEDGLLSLVFSRSYMPPRESSEGAEIVGRLRHLYARFAGGSGLTVPYTTVAYVGRPT